MDFLRSLDPKLISTVVTFALTRLALELGIDWDPTLEAIAAGIAASIVGYLTPNQATILRTAHDDGNPDVPADVVFEDETGGK